MQAAVIKQDSILELLLQPQETMAPAAGGVWRPLWRDGGNREASAGSTIGELALLQRQHSLLQEELLRLRDAESRLKDSERARAKLEGHVRHMKDCSGTAPASQLLGEQASQVRTCVLQFHKVRGQILLTKKVFTYKEFASECWCNKEESHLE